MHVNKTGHCSDTGPNYTNPDSVVNALKSICVDTVYTKPHGQIGTRDKHV